MIREAAAFTKECRSEFTQICLTVSCPGVGENVVEFGKARLSDHGSYQIEIGEKARDVHWRAFIIEATEYHFGDEVVKRPSSGDIIKWQYDEDTTYIFQVVKGILGLPKWEWFNRQSQCEYKVRTKLIGTE